MRKDLQEYIEARSIPVPFAGCWLWLASVGSHGYGNARADGVTTTAQRVSYRAYKGEIPPGMLVQHSCDNRICVNPDHLSLGTDKTNSDDKHRKGRANLDGRKFPPAYNRKLTHEQVSLIHASDLPNAELGRALGADAATIARIRRGEIYRELSPHPHHRPLRPLTQAQSAMVNAWFDSVADDEAEGDNEWPGYAETVFDVEG